VQNGTQAIWETAAQYHLVHAVLLFFIANSVPVRRKTWCALATGVIVFSGTLYLLAATNVRWLGAITPIGGLLLLAGWLGMAWPRPPTDHSIQIPR
jgi:uncharacterized membrane protein YgdD (TMEM256/DUF423 family)